MTLLTFIILKVIYYAICMHATVSCFSLNCFFIIATTSLGLACSIMIDNNKAICLTSLTTADRTCKLYSCIHELCYIIILILYNIIAVIYTEHDKAMYVNCCGASKTYQVKCRLQIISCMTIIVVMLSENFYIIMYFICI